MSVLHSLWLPIVASAIIVFFVSWILHVLIPWHKGDMKAVPNEAQVMDALRPFNLAPGDYALPHCATMSEYNSPAFQEKLQRGPTLTATVRGGAPSMGRSMILWFIFCLVVSYFAAYVGAHALSYVKHPTTHGHDRRLIALTAFTAYGLGRWQDSIWFGRSWGATVRHTIDALIYAVVTAAVFGWLG